MISVIGSGGFGKVYKYLNSLDKQLYAIKTIESKYFQCYSMI